MLGALFRASECSINIKIITKIAEQWIPEACRGLLDVTRFMIFFKQNSSKSNSMALCFVFECSNGEAQCIPLGSLVIRRAKK